MVCQVRKLRLRILPSAQSEHILSFLTIITLLKFTNMIIILRSLCLICYLLLFFSKDIEISFLLLFLLRSRFFS